MGLTDQLGSTAETFRLPPPDKEQALQFALMLQAGMPASEAILYFVPEDAEADQIADMLQRWNKSAAVRRATLQLQGKPWQSMQLEEKINHALDLHYAGLAWFLFSHNYAEVESFDKTKCDTARTALEAKRAGMAGKTDALTQFLDDFMKKKTTSLKVAPIPVIDPQAH